MTQDLYFFSATIDLCMQMLGTSSSHMAVKVCDAIRGFKDNKLSTPMEVMSLSEVGSKLCGENIYVMQERIFI